MHLDYMVLSYPNCVPRHTQAVALYTRTMLRIHTCRREHCFPIIIFMCRRFVVLELCAQALLAIY